MSTIQIRIDSKTKSKANKVLQKLGLDMSSAIKAYLNQVVIHEGIPFPILTENGLTMLEEQEIIKASKEAKKGVNTAGPFTHGESLKYLKRLQKKR